MTDNNAPAVLPDAPALSREARMEKAAQAADRAMANLSSDQQVNEVPGSPPARRESWTQKISHKLSNRNSRDNHEMGHGMHTNDNHSPIHDDMDGSTGATPAHPAENMNMNNNNTNRRTSWTQDMSRKAQNFFKPGAHPRGQQ